MHHCVSASVCVYFFVFACEDVVEEMREELAESILEKRILSIRCYIICLNCQFEK